MIDVTALYATEIAELTARRNLSGRGFDGTRSFIEKAVSFPQNINVEVMQTYTMPIDTGTAARGQRRRAGMRGNSGTVLTFHSMIKLPETPMMPRLFDERVGYFSQTTTDFGGTEARLGRARLHHALSAGEEGSERGDLRAGEADRVLRGSEHAEEVGGVGEARHRGVAAGVRGGRVQKRHHRQGSAEP